MNKSDIDIAREKLEFKEKHLVLQLRHARKKLKTINTLSNCLNVDSDVDKAEVGLRDRTLTDNILKILPNLKGEFTTDDVRDALGKRSQTYVDSFNPVTFNHVMKALERKGVISLEVTGKGAEPNFYILTKGSIATNSK